VDAEQGAPHFWSTPMGGGLFVSSIIDDLRGGGPERLPGLTPGFSYRVEAFLRLPETASRLPFELRGGHSARAGDEIPSERAPGCH
jgi:hypothetical protein